MVNILEFIAYILFLVYILISSIYYAIYEIKEKNNKFGGISVITFSIISVFLGIFSVIMSN